MLLGSLPAAASPYATFSNQSSATITETLTSGTYYYYVHAIQADGHDLWSAPMWITYQAGGGGDTTPPTTSITAPSAGATLSGTASVTAQAKVNLALRILAREGTGWHQIETLFARLELGDEVCVRTGARGMYSANRSGVFQMPTTMASRISPRSISRVIAPSTSQSVPV